MLLEQTDNVTLTPAASEAVRDLLTQRNLVGYALRVFVSGGGCSGYQFGMSLEANPTQEDHIFEYDGVKVVVDEISLNYLHGSTIDYVDNLTGKGFKIENPNVSCGCNSNSGGCGTASGGCSSCN